MQTTYYNIIHRYLKHPMQSECAIFHDVLEAGRYAINQQMNYNVERYRAGYGQFVEFIFKMRYNKKNK